MKLIALHDALPEINQFAMPMLTYSQRSPIKYRIAKHFFGFATASHPFRLVAFFEDDSDMPGQISGSYSSSDRGGQFDVKDARDIP
jgi:hypothetical protein